MNSLSHISSNLSHIQKEISDAAKRTGRDAAEITLVAVTKTYPIEYVLAAGKAGITNAGENRIQEAVPKIEALKSRSEITPLRWHLIGHLQSNKAKLAVQHFDLIHSVDSVKLAQEISRHAGAAGKVTSILTQINVSGEESKSGFDSGNGEAAVHEILASCPHLMIEGFMTMAPFEAPEDARPHFKALREIRDLMNSRISHPQFKPRELSMGMSNDYMVAIEEGATMVRIGSALFGARP